MNQPPKRPYQNYYYVSPRSSGAPPKRRPPRRRHGRRWLTLFIVLLLVFGVVYFLHHNSAAPSKPKQTTKAVISKAAPAQSKDEVSAATLATLGQNINTIINQNSGIDISVNLIDLNSGQSQHYGVNETFQAASTAKLITAADFLHEVESGQQSLSETINGQTAEYELQQMIVISDDNAWEALNEQLGYDNLQAYANTLGITDYQAYNNVLSSGDVAIVLQKLWDGELLNGAHTQLLLSYMKQANYRQYIVPAIPSGDTIYHKIGLYQDNVHDAAIITHGQQAFAIVIYTNGNGTYNWPGRATIMQDITKAALKAYFNQ